MRKRHVRSPIVQGIHWQLLALGIKRPLKHCCFIELDENTLKVSRGLRAALIRYDCAADRYDIDECREMAVKPLARGLYEEELLNAVLQALAVREESQPSQMKRNPRQRIVRVPRWTGVSYRVQLECGHVFTTSGAGIWRFYLGKRIVCAACVDANQLHRGEGEKK